MEITIKCGERCGEVKAPASKSHAHRLMICAALGKTPVTVSCGEISEDIAATANCLNSLCADVSRSSEGVISVIPSRRSSPEPADLRCGESGSTLRFLLPVCGALGRSARFITEGRLSQRPLFPLDELLRANGMEIRFEDRTLCVSGQLRSGEYRIAGNVSSQFISGLLFALPLLDGDSTLSVTGKVESESYISMTESALKQAGIVFSRSGWEYSIPGNQTYALPPDCRVEGDCSNAAFFLCAGALSHEGITVTNVPESTCQGDRKIIELLKRFGACVEENGDTVSVRKGSLKGLLIDASDIPDLVPVLSVVASVARGDTQFIHASRLRLKESNRLQTTAELLNSLGGNAEELEDGLIIHGVSALKGGKVSSCGDHRIAMSAGVASFACSGDIILSGSEAVNKSFPGFWEVLKGLGDSNGKLI